MAVELHARFAGQNDPGMYLVYPQDGGAECTCDIFVIHGLRGGATKTWQHADSGVVWFQSLLPSLIRDQTNREAARVWTFGYPGSVTFQTSSINDFAQMLLNRVKDVRKGHENRKIIWICHSLGGLIVKQALIDSHITARYQSIRANTTGIIFLGTPHQGSGTANLGSVVASVVHLAVPGIRIFNREILRDLKRSNNTLFDISSKFSNICSGISIHSFHETIPQGGTHLVVDRNSAILNLTNEVTRYGLNSVHQDLGKYRDNYDQNWLPVASSITELVLLTVPTSPPPLVFPNTSRPSGASTSQYGRPTPELSNRNTQAMHSNSSNQSRASVFSQNSNSQAGLPQSQTAQSHSPQPATRSYMRSGQQTTSAPPSRAEFSPQLRSGRAQNLTAYPTLNQEHSRTSLRSQSSTSGPPAFGSYSPNPPSDPESHDPGESVATCDACTKSIGSSQPRIQCTVCYDYDLCAHCFETGEVSKSHKSDHKISHILSTQVFSQDDLVPVSESVNPEFNAAGTKANWSVAQFTANTGMNHADETVCIRNLHLFSNDSHARFRAYSKPGHYGIQAEILVEVDKQMPPRTRQQLLQRPNGAGKLRVTLGAIRNNQQFFGTRFNEDTFTDSTLPANSLPNILLQNFLGVVYRIDADDTVIHVQPQSLVHLNAVEGSLVGLGLILQWSDVPGYQSSNDPVVSLSIRNIRMYNVLDYSEPFVRALPPVQRPAPVPSTTASSQEDDDDEDVPSAEEFLAALLQIQREVQNAQERARLEAILKHQLEQQEKAKREAVANLYAQAMQEVIEEAAREQEKRRQAAELARLLRALGLG